MSAPPCVRERVPLAGYTAFRIGGPARWFAEPADRLELAAALAFARREGAAVLPLGGGSNLLVDDAGVDAMALRLSPAGEFGRIEPEGGDSPFWRVGAAAGLPALVGVTVRAGAAGLESLAGIPGSVGGAARMNAGGGEGGIGRFVVSAEVWDFAGGAKSLAASELGFAYRSSALAGRLAVSLVLRLPAAEKPEALAAGARERREAKARKQPLDLPSAGCVFRNPPGDSAGRLLDAVGCKGWRRGGAEVSRKHANFIVNPGGAAARDVLELARAMRDAVEERFGVRLEPEVVVWGASL